MPAAGLLEISDPAGNGVINWKHVVLHYLRIHLGQTVGAVQRSTTGELRMEMTPVGVELPRISMGQNLMI